jgi:uncharacterized protein YprB with RNaseH-like and TPR domain
MPFSDLRDRLRDIIQPPSTTPAAPAPRDTTPLRVRLENTLGGTWTENEFGRTFVVRRRFEPSERHGAQQVREMAAVVDRAAAGAGVLGAKDARLPFVFFDLETTGLSGGAGTYAFLVGCGRFEDGAFLAEQHLLVDFAGERSMLGFVADALSRAGTLVTFNGKSFDGPVVETRYLFHRETSPCSALPHFDVLHPARRFWGLGSDRGCSLSTLESKVLGVHRAGDVPGIEIPARYFHFIRHGDPRPLGAVFEHNRLDLLSLAGLTARLLLLLEMGPDAAGDAPEALALGRAYDRAGLHGRAEHAFTRAVILSGSHLNLSPAKVEALRLLAIGARRLRQYELAATRWRLLLEVPGCPRHVSREAMEALAVHHEHRARDLETAKTFALKGLELSAGAARGEAVRHRLARIERKIVSGQTALLPSFPLQPSGGSQRSAPRTSS